jgi:hypothetical protein
VYKSKNKWNHHYAEAEKHILVSVHQQGAQGTLFLEKFMLTGNLFLCIRNGRDSTGSSGWLLSFKQQHCILKIAIQEENFDANTFCSNVVIFKHHHKIIHLE